jgi:hypothetical protein
MSFQCYYKDKYLHLSYPNIENISDDSEEGWNVSISEMNKIFKVYNECEKMYLDTDYYYRFPKIFLNFKKLKELKIRGTRMSHLDCTQIPESVEILDINSPNVNEDIINGIEKLVNLKSIFVDLSIILESSKIFPNLLNLKEIHLDLFSVEYIEDYDEHHKNELFNKIINHKIFDNIRHRITKIYLSQGICELFAIVELDKLNELKRERRTKRRYGEKCECTGYPYMCNKHTTD